MFLGKLSNSFYSPGIDPVSTPFILSRSGRPPIYGDFAVPATPGKSNHSLLPLVVFAHGFRGHKDWGFIPFLFKEATARGFAAVKFNFSHSGVVPPSQSVSGIELFKDNKLKYELEDYEILFESLAGGEIPGSSDIALHKSALVGFSRSGSTALLYCANQRTATVRARISTLCTIGAPAEWFPFTDEEMETWRNAGKLEFTDFSTGSKIHLSDSVLIDLETNKIRYDPVIAAGRINIPWLLVHGALDKTIPPEQAHILFEHSDQRLTNLQVIDGASHSLNSAKPFSKPHSNLQILAEMLFSFLKLHLR